MAAAVLSACRQSFFHNKLLVLDACVILSALVLENRNTANDGETYAWFGDFLAMLLVLCRLGRVGHGMYTMVENVVVQTELHELAARKKVVKELTYVNESTTGLINERTTPRVSESTSEKSSE